MDTTVQVAIIAAAASIIAAVVGFVFNKRAERADALQERMVNHYRELLCALSDLAVDSADQSCRHRYAQAVNTIALVAPQDVVSCLMRFQNNVTSSNRPSSSGQGGRNYQPELNQLLLEIRRSLNLPFEDDPSTFDITLVGIKLRGEV